MIIDGNGAISLNWIFYLLFTYFWGGVYASWWVLSRMHLSAVHIDTHQCIYVSGLERQQREICLKNPDMLPSISRGARMGIRECQTQLQDRRWNCSTLETGFNVFGKVTERVGSRESAFVYAISSAAVAYSIANSCAKGEVKNCDCDPLKQQKSIDAEGEIIWKGCMSYIKFGSKFAKAFINAREGATKDARVLMNLHNNRAGIKALRKFTKKTCKCHGISGSCELRTCWPKLRKFKEIGAYLKSQYDRAVQVTLDQFGTLVAVEGRKPFTQLNLVYFEPSPDYCFPNKNIGTLGTAGRQCKKSSQGPDGCEVMCCGMGYDTILTEVVGKCNCLFEWCCTVHCDVCRKMVYIHTCKAGSNRYYGQSRIG